MGLTCKWIHKNMICTKFKWTLETFHYVNSETECVKSVQYLGFNIYMYIYIYISILSRTIATVFNYMIEQRYFPDAWSGGIRSAIFKSGKRNIEDNFRGITILPIMEKVSEAVVYWWLVFVKEAFAAHDRCFFRGKPDIGQSLCIDWFGWETAHN